MKIETRIACTGIYAAKMAITRVAHRPEHHVYIRFDRPRAAMFDLTAPGHMYSRISIRRWMRWSRKIAALEVAWSALCTTSEQAAAMIALLNPDAGGRPHRASTSTAAPSACWR